VGIGGLTYLGGLPFAYLVLDMKTAMVYTGKNGKEGVYLMKSWFKIVSWLFLSLIVVGAVTMLAIKYFDVMVRGFETVRDQVARKKELFFGNDCCGYDDDDLEEAEEL
jgi:hypothetical protein